MILSANNILLPENTKTFEVNLYREQLLRYIEDYGLKMRKIADTYSKPANEKAKIILAHEYNKNIPELNKDFEWAINNAGNKTREILHAYIREMMLLLGNICECIIIDRCKKNPILNMQCINYACFRPHIDEMYNDIPYQDFTPFSPSHKRIVLYTDAGILHYQDNVYASEINHENKDIIWCNKNHTEEILKASIPGTAYNNDARLQIKASTNYHILKSSLDEKKYRFSPIIYFDLNRDIGELCKYLFEKKSCLYVQSAMAFSPSLMEECNTYFRLLAGYFSGLFSIHEEFTYDLTSMNNGVISHLFNTDIKRLLSDEYVTQSEQLLSGLQNTIICNNQANVIEISTQ